ncbi:cytochrome-c oxidase, cbb3-type subunit III [Defluviimonas salinarum]|uniref:Cbb3-type cytochrome c oxidase subunit n=1 Tax=Defluviimonas salinarum TaxID=2992147 RepID=A0ABT3J6R6_9RHOB|nr:cytochrome-c oxidase, cbb3-type subunit III [Defluviimonas salinarum]MCW3783378.1 cytochrome-c oxidase, cbb3-type subunit III [Defluviimonas salinarum]
MSRKPIKQKADPETTGHEWDGIQEWDNPMPRWWLWTFYATIIWGIAYTIAYPAWPLVTQATQGIFGQKNRAAVAAEIQRYEDANAPVEAKLVAADLTAIASDPELQNYTMNAGGAVFRTWCAQCHGSGAAGAVGYPNLLDNDWLWGGTIEDIHTTVSHGIRNTEDADARYSEMPRFGADELLEPEQIDQVVNHVLKISGQEADEALAAEGATVYADNCAGCHGEDGTGDRAQGAPNLTDAIWLYGGDVEALTESVSNARFGVMPAWAGRLSEAEIRAVAAWVHSRGGGE